jgi:hypothetical protein
MLSVVRVRFVKMPLRPGFTPKFSQLIHDNLAVKSAKIKFTILTFLFINILCETQKKID